MKNKILYFLSQLFLQILFILCLLWGFTYAAISWPNNGPNWEVSWWLFQSYFNKIFDTCPTGQVLQWYDKNSGKKCVLLKP